MLPVVDGLSQLSSTAKRVKGHVHRNQVAKLISVLRMPLPLIFSILIILERDRSTDKKYTASGVRSIATVNIFVVLFSNVPHLFIYLLIILLPSLQICNY